jgi:hypothetical protein
MNELTHTIELSGGYENAAGRHTRVVFGKRLRGLDLMFIDEDPQSNIPTQYQLLIVREAITEFGSLPMTNKKGQRERVPLPILLALDADDIEALIAGHNEFAEKGLEGRAPDFISDGEVKLPIGFESNGLVYNRVRFGRRVTGYDLVEADKKDFSGLRRECFLIGREIASLSTDDGAHTLDGPIEVQVFEQLDGADLVALRAASMIWRSSFRRGREGVQAKSVAAQHAAAGGTDGVERGGDPVAHGRPPDDVHRDAQSVN